MSTVALLDLRFRLAAPSLGFGVEVRLRSFGTRWTAAADIGGEVRIAVGTSPRQALMVALEPLGPRASTALLAELTLLAPSATIAEFDREARREVGA